MAEKKSMTLSRDLLEQARFLAQREKLKPKQASLRRAVSTAYYAVFYLLAGEAATQACSANIEVLRLQVQRALKHTTMQAAAQPFRATNLPDHLKGLVSLPLEPELISVAKGFISLQEQRHKADYDMLDVSTAPVFWM
jgi:hypothetical protein